MTDYRLATALVGAGVVLVLVGLALPVDAAPTYRYEAEPIEPSTVETLYLSETLDCTDRERPRPCALERRVLDGERDANGTRTLPLDVPVESPREGRSATVETAGYEFVRVDSGYYVPNGTVDDEGIRLRLEPTTRRRVLVAETRGYLGAPDPVQRAIIADDGAATGEAVPWDGSMVVRVNDDYYAVGRDRVDRPFADPATRWAAKAASLLVGFGLLLYGRGKQVRARAG